MAEVVGALRRSVPAGCQAVACEDAGCSLAIDDIADPWVLVDLDCEGLSLRGVTHADFLLATQGGVLACIELKGGKTIRGAVEQIQESSFYVEDELRLSVHVTQFRPILGHHVKLKVGQRKHLQMQRIEFQKKGYSIRLIPCGGRLADALGSPA